LHEASLSDTLLLADALSQCAKFLYIAPPAHRAELQRLPHAAAFRSDWTLRRQRGGGLGARLLSALGELLAEGARRIVIVGTDSPWMGPRRIARAFRLLRRYDVVLGPAEDGGYYLIGARRLIPKMFDEVPWGTGRVLSRTLARLKSLRVRTILLQKDFDLDRPRDLRRLQRLLRRGKQLPPALALELARQEFAQYAARKSPGRRGKRRVR